MADLAYVLNLKGKEIANNGKTGVPYNEKYSFDLSLYGVSFKRKIYQPGHIQAEILIETGEVCGGVDVEDLSGWLLNSPASLSVGGFTVASSYYVHEISPQFIIKTYRTESEKENGISVIKNYYSYDIYVKLDIFSPDKKMMLNKFSRAYLGKRLVDDIMTDGVQDFGITDLKKGILQQIDHKVSEVVSSDENLLVDESGTTQKKVTNTTVEEQKDLIYPYLVQYNESFYDFISRVANRVGEVFYYDDGKFCVGLSGREVPEFGTAISRIVFQRISDAPLKVRDYTRDSVKGEWTWKNEGKDNEEFKVTYKPDGLVTDPVETDDDGYPLDAFPRLEKSAATNYHSHYYNSETAVEEQYMILYKNKFAKDDYGDVLWGDTDEHLVGWLSDILNSTSLLEVVSNFAAKGIQALIKSGMKCGEKNEKGNSIVSDQALSSSKDYAVLFAKVDDNPDNWVTLNYQHDIRELEEQQMRKMVCVDMGTNFANVRLGDKITLPNESTQYVVVRVEMSSATPWQKSYDGFESDEPAPTAVQSQRIFAIPLSRKKFYPPVLPMMPFRQSGPQPAFIVDAGDKRKQGRVRVRFPWQASVAGKKQAEKDAKDELDKYKPTFNSARDRFEEYADFTLPVDMSDIDNDPDLQGDEHKAEREAKKAARQQMAEKAAMGYEWEYSKKSTVTEAQYQSGKSQFEPVRNEYFRLAQVWKKAQRELMIEEAATPWIRMATPMASADGSGLYFQPEKGDEVMVDFVNGNIEHPYVVGALYSKNTTIPDAGSREIVSRNGHTIKMDDPTDAYDFVAGIFPAFKLLKSYGWDFEMGDLTGNSRKILGGIELTDKYGLYNIKMSSHDRNISISSPFGDVDIDAFTGISINSPNGDISITGKNIEISAYNKLTIESGKNIKGVGDKYRMGYFSSMIDPKALGKAAAKTLAKMTYGKLFDLSLLRSIIEVVIRPVDGSLLIKSNRFVHVEAGKGETSGEIADYATHKHDRWFGKTQENKALLDIMTIISQRVDAYIPRYMESFKAVHNAVKSFTDFRGAPAVSKLEKPANKAALLKDMFSKPAFTTEDALTAAYDAYIGDNNHFKLVAGIAEASANRRKRRVKALMRAAMLMKKCVDEYSHLFDGLEARFARFDLPTAATPILTAKAVPGDEKDLYVSSIQKVMATDPEATLYDAEIPDGTFDVWKKYVKRRLVFAVIEKCRANPTTFTKFEIPDAEYKDVRTVDDNGLVSMTPCAPTDRTAPFSDDDWKKYVNEITLVPKDPDTQGFAKAWDNFKSESMDQLTGLIPWEFAVWEAGAKGRILFSDEEGKTYRFKKGAIESYDNIQDRAISADEVQLCNDLKDLA